MKTTTTDVSLNMTIKVLGVMFWLTLIVPLINYVFVFQNFPDPDNTVETANNILDNEFLFRINIINEIFTALIVFGLATALFSLLRQTNKNLARFALSLKLTEASLWLVIALGHFASLLILKDNSLLGQFESGQLQSLIGLMVNEHLLITAIPGVLHGLGLTIFMYLLFKSKLISNKLALFGLISFALVFVYDALFIISPNTAEVSVVQLIGWVPSILFEIVIGGWLLIKGIDEKLTIDRIWCKTLANAESV